MTDTPTTYTATETADTIRQAWLTQTSDIQALEQLLNRFGVAYTTYGPEDHLMIHGPGTHSIVIHQVGDTHVEGYQPLWASWQFHADGRFAEIVIGQ